MLSFKLKYIIFMPVTKSAKKALRRDWRREKINLKIKNRVRAAIKSVRKSPTKKILSQAFSLLDRAAKKKIFHRNKTARLKSRLAKLLLKKAAKS